MRASDPDDVGAPLALLCGLLAAGAVAAIMWWACGG
jgi:hypothetical protein